MAERLVTLQEASARTGFKVSTWRAWILLRKVPYHKVGRSIRIAESDLTRMIEQSRIPAREEGRATLADVAQARPQRSTGAPARSRSHYDTILNLLRERGPQGVLGSELYARPELYGRSPRNRISELRRDGYLIEGRAHGASDWFYRLIRDDVGVSPRARAESPDWYERATGRQRPQLGKDDFSSLPLFEGRR